MHSRGNRPVRLVPVCFAFELGRDAFKADANCAAAARPRCGRSFNRGASHILGQAKAAKENGRPNDLFELSGNYAK